MFVVCPFVSEQTLTWNGPRQSAAMLGGLWGESQSCPCVPVCMRAKRSNWGRGASFHAPLSLELGAGALVSFPITGKKKRNKQTNKSGSGKPRACEKPLQAAWVCKLQEGGEWHA